MDDDLVRFVAYRFLARWFPHTNRLDELPDFDAWLEIALADAEVAAQAVLDFLGDDGK